MSCHLTSYLFDSTILVVPFFFACFLNLQTKLFGMSVILSWERRYGNQKSDPPQVAFRQVKWFLSVIVTADSDANSKFRTYDMRLNTS